MNREALMRLLARLASPDRKSRITDEMSLHDDLGLDSLSVLELLVEIDRLCGHDTADAVVTAFRESSPTVGSIAQLTGVESARP